MNPVMGKLGNGVAQLLQLSAAKMKSGDGAATGNDVNLPFAALLSEANGAIGAKPQTVATSTAGRTADVALASDLMLANLPLTDMPQTNAPIVQAASVEGDAIPTGKMPVSPEIAGEAEMAMTATKVLAHPAAVGSGEKRAAIVPAKAVPNFRPGKDTAHVAEKAGYETEPQTADGVVSVAPQPVDVPAIIAVPPCIESTPVPASVPDQSIRDASTDRAQTLSGPSGATVTGARDMRAALPLQKADKGEKPVPAPVAPAGVDTAPAIQQHVRTANIVGNVGRQPDLPADVAAKMMAMAAGKTRIKAEYAEKHDIPAGTTPPAMQSLGQAGPMASAKRTPLDNHVPALPAGLVSERAKAADDALADVTIPAVSLNAPPPNVPAQSGGSAPLVDLSASLGRQVIDMGSGGQWIDGLAREIAALSKGEGHGSFRLSPENLGPMRVDIRPGDGGANVTLTVETKAAESMLMQDRNLLKADAQLAAVKIDDVIVQRVAHVHEPSRADTATGQGSGGQGTGGQSQPQTASQGQSGQGQNANNAALAQGQSGQGGNNPRNHKVSTDAAVSSQAEPRGVAEGHEPGTTRRARYA